MEEENQDGSQIDDILLEESTGDDEGSADLEMDAFQATEVRAIFLTTLPDYLEPVKQMLDQLLSADDPAGMRQALDTTLESIQTAASRVQIDDVSDVVQHMRAQLSGSGPIPEENRDSLWAGIERIERIVLDVASNETRVRSETVVSALGRVGGFDDVVLEKLTAAGLVTVDQIRMADPGEIVAVSGLDAAVVERVVAAVADPALAEPPDKSLRASENPPVASEKAAPAVDAPADELEALLRRQVDSELDIEESRGRILRIRTSLQDLKKQLASAEAERLALEKALGAARKELGDKLQSLSQIKTHRSELEREHGTLRQQLDRIAKRIADLERRSSAVQEERLRFARHVSAATRTVAELVHSSRREREHSPADPVRKS